MLTSDFDYELPPEYIAQHPVEPRDTSRLLVLDRQSGRIEHVVFRNLGQYLAPGDLLVLNETRVIPARLFARKLPSGGKVEILLLSKQSDQIWEVLVGGKRVTAGKHLQVLDQVGKLIGITAEVTKVMDGSRRLIQFSAPVEPILSRAGHMPLPPYIHAPLSDPERYQTVYARLAGSAAAPTAGLHFTTDLINQLAAQGVKIATVTLHVGLDTFAPVIEADPREHKIHTEWCEINQEAVSKIHQARQAGKRVIAVGTTSVRTLETAASGGTVHEVSGPTSVYILPGYKFQVVDAMITNFHLPRSTLLMLVSAFAGRDKILAAYELAKRNGYRFYSFGDAMVIL